ncbi:TPA: hypothetical protein ACP5XP_004513 [Vibrio parahaemolyticus]|nr:hypothetical protein [Vibrio parahaemolyticus]
MIKITCEINGSKVDPKNMKNALEAAVLSSVVDNVKKSVGSLKCGEHAKAPSIKIKGKSIDKLSFEISSCCEELDQKVRSKLS